MFRKFVYVVPIAVFSKAKLIQTYRGKKNFKRNTSKTKEFID